MTRVLLHIIVLYGLFSIELLAQQCDIIYVSTGGVDSGLNIGSKDNPSSLFYGLSMTNNTLNTLYLASGTYALDTSIYLKSNLKIVGGFDPISWEKTNAANTVLFRNTLNPDTNPERLVAIYGNNISGFELQDIVIQTANVFTKGASTYGIHLSSCSNYSITRCKVIAGNAANGNAGAKGDDGLDGIDGDDGEDGDETNEPGYCCRLGGIGGSGSFAGSSTGGNGGDGGEQGFYVSPAGGDAYNGYAGTAGVGPGAGVEGNGGYKIVVSFWDPNCVRTPGNDGQTGLDGLDGNQGLNGVPGNYGFNNGFFIPGNGTNGTIGDHGYGGGGGGGGGSLGGVVHDWPFNGFPDNKNGTGAGGGGAGEGGQAGEGGEGAQGGGSSFALYLYQNGVNGFIYDCQLSAGNYGLAGIGGNGGAGGNGGSGGDGGGIQNCNIGAGGEGGNGGNGGNGGIGGNGADGISDDIYEDNCSNSLNVYNIYSLQQPLVYVNNGGCTGYPVYFNTQASGNVQWYFGSGATPATSVGVQNFCTYSTTGKKTFTLVNNGIAYTYSSFIEILSQSTSGMSQINSTDSILCAGATGSYSATSLADEYLWLVTGPDSTDTIQGATAIQLSGYTFDSAGSYNVILKTYDNCCGYSFPDTFNVAVENLQAPGLSILCNDADLTICKGEPLDFLASDSLGLNNLSYKWYLNGTNTNVNSYMYSSNLINDGDQIYCVAEVSIGCSAGLTDTSDILSITVIDAPLLSCNADSFYLGSPTYLNATVSSGGLSPFTYQWDFGDTTYGSGDSVVHIYPGLGAFSYSVTVTDSNNCTGTCQGLINIVTELIASFSADTVIGCAPMSVQFTNESLNAITYHWTFGDGNASNTSDPSHTFINPGNYTVTLKAFGSGGNDSLIVASQVFVHSSPVSNFQAFPQHISKNGDSVYFADNSLNATNWYWTFGDVSSGAANNSSLQNPVHYYASDGNYNVSLHVSNTYSCDDSITKENFISIEFSNINEPFAISQIILYPNPFNEDVFIETKGITETNIHTNVYDMQGKRVASFNISEQKKIRAGSWEPGTYLISFTVNEKTFSTYVIKQ
ncbi:MAG TPA: PKD domain-containing protein [Bacteroidetes bacterium]|nr:PKD domain-containing protein [Bacteroidota bacterium]